MFSIIWNSISRSHIIRQQFVIVSIFYTPLFDIVLFWQYVGIFSIIGKSIIYSLSFDSYFAIIWNVVILFYLFIWYLSNLQTLFFIP